MIAREISAIVLSEVLRHRKHLDKTLSDHLEQLSDNRERKLTYELSYGVMRWYHQLYFITQQLLKKPVKEKDTDILALILMGLYQLKYLRIPDHAAISATVETTIKLGKPWARDLVNAILRKYQREQDLIEHMVDGYRPAYYSHPDWLINKLKMQWPEYWQNILATNNQYPPLHLRLDIGKHTREEYTDMLQEKGIEFYSSNYAQTGIGLINPLGVEEIPGFQEGYVSVQDFSAQLAVPLLDCLSDHRILDACAAPGGKTAHILEQDVMIRELVSVDISAERMKLLSNSLKRLGKTASMIVGDISNSADWWDGNQFDRILLDAPCSASGVIRRHPDIKYNRIPEQFSYLKCCQFELLTSVWPLLKSNGKLLYCTCSVLHEEADQQIAKFITQYNDAEIYPINADWGVNSQYGRHTIPGHDEGDGFYYSIIRKKIPR